MFNWIKVLLLSAARCTETEQTQRERERERGRERERERERERGVHAEQSRRRERERERERERCVRVLGEQDLALAQYRWFSETRFGRFFGGKKIAKGVCNVAKLATLCISISPTTAVTENTRCVNRALKKLVPLKWICVNALLTR